MQIVAIKTQKIPAYFKYKKLGKRNLEELIQETRGNTLPEKEKKIVGYTEEELEKNYLE